MDSSYKVKIHLYDLSQGMAKNFGRMLLGKDIEGIWHTGIEIYGKEFYYGGGICKDKPKQTPYGFPVREIDMGTTEIPEEIFLDFLREIGPKFAMEKYDLFTNNCNNFTDECCSFLTGKPLPDFITGLPKEVLGTSLGQMIKPMIDQMQSNMTKNSNPLFEQQNQAQQSTGSYGGGGYQQPSTQSSTQPTGDAAIEVGDAFTFNNYLTNTKGVIVGFYSNTCPPCMAIKPVYEALAKGWRTNCPDIKFLKVNTQVARDIAGKYAITSIPTFIGFYDGKQIERFSGANKQKIESLAYMMEKKINESKGEKQESTTSKMDKLNVSFNLFNADKKDAFVFIPDNFDVPIKKITSMTEGDAETPMRKLFMEFSQNPKVNLKNFSPENKGNLVSWIIEKLFALGISETTIPMVDMIRLLASDPVFAEAILTKSPERVEQLFDYLDIKDEELIALPRGLKMILLRTLTNLAAAPKSEAVFGKAADKLFQKLVRIIRALKDDRASNYACLMFLFNLILLLEKNKEYLESRKDVIQLMLDLLKNENDEKNQLALVVNLSWLIYDNKGFKTLANEKADKIKLLKMESSDNSNLRLATQDLIALLENKL